ncbi:AMIN domain-containing protein, partial [Campylobacter coli]|nr:AMIN domain-containing protein [Campylobacter coli]
MKTKILGIFLIFISLLNAEENPFKSEQNMSMI